MMRRIWTAALFVVCVLLLAPAGAPALAQEAQPNEPVALSLSTLYPVQEVAFGENVDFELILRTDAAPQTVRLDVQDLPAGWTVTFRGGGKVVHAAHVEADEDTKVSLRVELPQDVQGGSYRFVILADGELQDAQLPIELIVKEKVPPSLSFQTELPTLRGAPTTDFRFDTTLKNEGDTDLSVNLVSDAPPEFQVKFKSGGQEVTDLPVEANQSKRLSVEAKAFVEVPAGAYPINVIANGGQAQARLTLTAEVIGQPDLSLSGPDGRLSGTAHTGEVTPFQLVLRNNGSAPARNIELSASQPTGWSVEFTPKQLVEIAAGQQQEVTAQVKPPEKAMAGDYVVTFRARPEGASNEAAEYRITVLTSTLWGVVGIGLIAVAVVIVGLAVMRFGRR